nr:immunoglobulin heavy chain junction region [Macaca mulatta]MOY24507.1 immunoglobulin heavy chain junction region [Macaca mulatta]MOY25711.1 immunoglobulin heavy chain junction region [Macaca mulatta]MOY27217.1 immunoglobulin heavy chain junction region [Macaca mulatta]MOY28409.1 immunoglobulin heavy chain junction region [Macaca mulatta]
CARGVPNNLW